MTAKL